MTDLRNGAKLSLMQTATATETTTLATFALWESTVDGLVNKPVTVEESAGAFDVMSSGEPVATFRLAAEAMAFALELCGWLHAVSGADVNVAAGEVALP